MFVCVCMLALAQALYSSTFFHGIKAGLNQKDCGVSERSLNCDTRKEPYNFLFSTTTSLSIGLWISTSILHWIKGSSQNLYSARRSYSPLGSEFVKGEFLFIREHFDAVCNLNLLQVNFYLLMNILISILYSW